MNRSATVLVWPESVCTQALVRMSHTFGKIRKRKDRQTIKQLEPMHGVYQYQYNNRLLNSLYMYNVYFKICHWGGIYNYRGGGNG